MFQESKEDNKMNCHYCEKEIKEKEESIKLTNNKTKQESNFHFPQCYVRFTTFYKTKKQLIERGYEETN